ncbi:MAG: hypothetical protein AAF772_18960 [Acidobacteriota bacterium]
MTAFSIRIARARHRFVLSVLLLVGGLLIASIAVADDSETTAPTRMTITYTEDDVVIAGLEPGNSIAWMTVKRVLDGFTVNAIHDAGTATDGDKDGQINFRRSQPAPTGVVWGAVDLETGAMAINADVVPDTRWPFESRGLGRSAGEQVDRLRLMGRAYRLLIVRPGVGAWRLGADDGGHGDIDRAQNGVVTLALEGARSVEANTQTPFTGGLQAGDRLFVIQPDRLYTISASLDAAQLEKAVALQ